MVKVWGKLIKKNRIIESYTVEFDSEPTLQLYFDALQKICYKLDIELPIILTKHKNDMIYFNLVRFLPSDFMEKVSFEKFDIEIFIEKEKSN